MILRPGSSRNKKRKSKMKRPWYPRTLDWSVILFLYLVVSLMQYLRIEAHHRCVPGFKDIGDTTFQCGDQKYIGYSSPVYDQTIPGLAVPIIGMSLYIGCLLINAIVLRMKSNDCTSAGLLNHIEICLRMLLFSAGTTLFINSLFKLAMGRPRPNFYALMETDDDDRHRAARRSFPSGHSAYAASMLYLLSLNLYAAVRYVQKQVMKGRRIRESMDNPHCYFFGHDCPFLWHYPRICVMLSSIPAVIAVLIAATRVYDKWHHASDVLAGLFLGMTVAKLTYRFFRKELEWKHRTTDEYDKLRPCI